MSVNSVFYAESYHPIQAGSIDGTDILPHDNAIYRAHLCSEARLYEPFGDTNVTGDPYCTIFVGRLSHLTTEDTLRKAMSKYGQVKNVRLVRHIVTGASRGYAFVEFASEREMRRAYEDAHHSMIDDYEIMVDYNRQQLMPGWIPRRLGGGLGGKKESGQLRFGGRERPFRAPLRPIPYDDLKKLGIPAPPEGRYMSRFQVPSPPRKSSTVREEGSHRRRLMDREENTRRRESSYLEDHSERGDRSSADRNRSREREERHSRRRIRDKEEQSRERSYTHDDESPPRRKRSRERPTREEPYSKRSSKDKEEQSREGSYRNEEEPNASRRKRSRDKEERSHERSSRDKERSSHRRDRDRDRDQEKRSHRRQKHSSKSHWHDKSGSQDQLYDD